MSQNTYAQASWHDLFRGRNAALALVLSGGVALHAINIYLSTTILPTVVADIGGREFYAWNTTLFVVASIIGAAFSSKLLHGLGARTAYLSAAALLFTGSLIAALSPNIGQMLLGRTVQGLGGGIMVSLGYGVVALVFEERLWQRAFALVSGMWGVATLFGPAIGGIFAELGIWRFAFGVMLPVIVVYAIAVVKLLPQTQTTQQADRLALTQLVLLSGAILAIATASIFADLTLNALALLMACGLIGLLIRVERRASIRLLPRAALIPGSRLFATFATMALLLFGTSSGVFMPYFLQHLHGQTPLIAGYLAALTAVGWTGAELLSARYHGRRADRAIRLGPCFSVAGLIGLLLLVPLGSTGLSPTLVLICGSLILVGFGIGFCWPHLATLVFKLTTDEDHHLASSSMTSITMFASAFGASVAGMIANLTGFSRAESSLMLADSAFWLQSLFALIVSFTLFSAVAVVRKRDPQPADAVTLSPQEERERAC
ncbi:MFS transporter [Motiliproteus sp.]|uniref:MFS transporter n=1 Tax=Motiliproteus sp. TaxID=1898955 RepID=UPI003BAC32E3